MRVPGPVFIGLVGAASCLLAMMCAPSAARSQQITGAEAGWTAMKRCAALANGDLRHACADDVLRRAGLLGGGGTASSNEPGPTAKPSSPERRDSFGLPATSREAPQRETKQRETKQLDTTLASVVQGADGKLLLTTTDGAVWRQVESDSMLTLPERGQTLTIKQTLFGGFMCKAGKWISFRCRRVR